MKRSSRILVLLAAILGAGLPLIAQTSTAVLSAQQRAKPQWLTGEVVHADRNSIVVRERNNPLAIHTFSYSPAVKSKMELRDDQGVNFHSGDAVKIRYQPGSTVALKIHGKPSKQ